ncbi:DNA-binding response OmpR family regulator [Inhella inkyongensis]|uniref:DNA-binding response OmpR family regulator n=1 Tax=Inhella inkyongensis TaxID=392593 RepID=A0A840S8T1_9BURK|nr:response regulator transcription factor [Inhella inkyongensis]MBB5204830.1 DNA-binding response OmpR family regulator [Inhella inkyongensis]
MRILLVEDDWVLGDGLRAFLRAEGQVVDWCPTLAQASAALRGEPFDAWLLDWQLPDGSGLDWLQARRAQGLRTPALMLTARETLNDRIQGLDGGADDYLVKPFAPEELAARLRACVRRQLPSEGALTLQGGAQVQLQTRSAQWQGQKVELTAREWALMEALLLRSGRWVSKADLEALALGFDGQPASSNSLEVHIANLRRKLGRSAIETLRGLGYRCALETP